MLHRHPEVARLKRLPLAEGGLQGRHIEFLLQRGGRPLSTRRLSGKE